MIKRVLACALAAAVLVAVAGCGASSKPNGEVSMPATSESIEGTPYQDVVGSLESAGFTNVKTKSLEDLVIGFLKKPGDVKEVSVAGTTDFTTDDSFPPDAKIVVSYHSFPADKDNVKNTPTPSTPAPVTTPADDVLRVTTSPDLAAVLSLAEPCDPKVADFAAKYDGRAMEFDGNVAVITQHGDTKTRFDMLIGAGDFNASSEIGPTFQFRDVNTTSDLHLTGANVPDSIVAGTNFHFVAQIGDYDSGSCLFQLTPISTEQR